MFTVYEEKTASYRPRENYRHRLKEHRFSFYEQATPSKKAKSQLITADHSRMVYHSVLVLVWALSNPHGVLDNLASIIRYSTASPYFFQILLRLIIPFRT